MAPNRDFTPPPGAREDDVRRRGIAAAVATNSFQFGNDSSTKVTKTTVERKQTRPIGEFGGNLGCLWWIIFIPTAIYYFYGCVAMNKGNLAVPDGAFWYKLYYELPAGMAIRPTIEGFVALSGWIFAQALLEVLLPGPVLKGVVQKNNRSLEYPMNGLRSFFLTHILLYAAVWYGYIDPAYVYKQMGALLTAGVILSKLIALWIFIDWGVFWKRHAQDPEFEEDWGVFSWKECIHDYFLGVARNPRIGHNLLKVPFDIKRFSNARPGLTGWVVCNQSYLAAIYYGCHLEDDVAVCAATGDFQRVGMAAIFITVAHWYYIFDYNYFEPAYLTTTDIRHDLYGWMLSYGLIGFLMWYYPISFLGDLAGQYPHLTGNTTYVTVGIILYLIGMFLFRQTNIQKHRFRTYISEGGDLNEYKVWGKPVKYIKTEEGSYLLCSGYWSFARHFNYIGDMIMCIGWTVACAGPNRSFPWIPLSYVAYFWLMDLHRMWRDECRCARKYKKDWEEYKKVVKYWIVPGVF